MKHKNYLQLVPLSLGVLVLSFFVGYLVLATWTAPTVAPPGGQPVLRAGALVTTTATPVAADCDEAIERGRVRINPATNRQYICGDAGWIFLAATPMHHTLTVSITGSGTVVSTPAGISCSPTCAGSFSAGATVTLTATPATGWGFAGWDGACTGTAGCSVVMNTAHTVTATFVQRTLTVSITGSGTVTSSPAGINCVGPATCASTFTHGTTVTLSQTPATGWGFTGWGGACTGTAGCSVVMNTALTVQASFVVGPATYFLFASGTIHTGHLGGRAGANNICRTSTTRPAVCTAERTWAFISVTDTDEIRDFPAAVPAWTGNTPFNTAAPWYWRHGTHAGIRADNNWAGLLDGTILNPGSMGGHGAWYWTGSSAAGALLGNACLSWTFGAAGSGAVMGSGSDTDGRWLDRLNACCSNTRYVLCACS